MQDRAHGPHGVHRAGTVQPPGPARGSHRAFLRSCRTFLREADVGVYAGPTQTTSLSSLPPQREQGLRAHAAGSGTLRGRGALTHAGHPLTLFLSRVCPDPRQMFSGKPRLSRTWATWRRRYRGQEPPGAWAPCGAACWPGGEAEGQRGQNGVVLLRGEVLHGLGWGLAHTVLPHPRWPCLGFPLRGVAEPCWACRVRWQQSGALG